MPDRIGLPYVQTIVTGHREICIMLVLIASIFLGIVLAGALPALAAHPYQPPDWKSLLKTYQCISAPSIEERFQLAICYANVGDFKGADRVFKEIEKEDWRAVASAMMERSEKAMADGTDTLMDLNAVAFVAYLFNDYEKSSKTFEAIVAADPDNYWPRLYLAFTYGTLGRIDEAVAHLEYVAKKEPFNLYVRALLIYAKVRR